MVKKTAQRKRFRDKANVPAEHPAPEAEARLSSPDEDEGRTSDSKGPARQRPSQAVGLTTETVRRRESLRSRREFQRVLAEGRAGRRDGITVFVGNYDPEVEPRLGLAVRSKGSSVRRNRARRRLRAAAAECKLPPRDVVIRAEGVVADMEFQEMVDHLKAAVAGME